MFTLFTCKYASLQSAFNFCRTPPAPHVCLLIRCRYDARQWNSHESHVWNVVISVGGIFL